LSISTQVIPESVLYHYRPCECEGTGFTGQYCNFGLFLLHYPTLPLFPSLSFLFSSLLFSSFFLSLNGACSLNLLIKQGLDECSSNPCMNGGVCVDILLGYECWCRSNFVGKQCETPVSSSCGHGRPISTIYGKGLQGTYFNLGVSFSFLLFFHLCFCLHPLDLYLFRATATFPLPCFGKILLQPDLRT